MPYTSTRPAVLCHTAPQATGWRRADTGPALGLGSHPPSSPLLSSSSSFSSSFFSSRQHKGSAGEQLRRATKPPTHVFLLTCLTILVPPALLLPILPLHPSLQFASTTFLNFKNWGSKAQTVFLPCLQLHSTHLNSPSSSSLTFALLPHFLNKTLGGVLRRCLCTRYLPLGTQLFILPRIWTSLCPLQFFIHLLMFDFLLCYALYLFFSSDRSFLC